MPWLDGHCEGIPLTSFLFYRCMSFFVQRVVAHLQETARCNLDNSLTSVKKGACFKTSSHL